MANPPLVFSYFVLFHSAKKTQLLRPLLQLLPRLPQLQRPPGARGPLGLRPLRLLHDGQRARPLRDDRRMRRRQERLVATGDQRREAERRERQEYDCVQLVRSWKRDGRDADEQLWLGREEGREVGFGFLELQLFEFAAASAAAAAAAAAAKPAAAAAIFLLPAQRERGLERTQRLHLCATKELGQVQRGVVYQGELMREDVRAVRRVHCGQRAVE